MTSYISKIILAGILIAGLCGGLGIGYGEEKEDPNIIKEVTVKKITGEVMGISQNFIAVFYWTDKKKQDSLEMALNIDKDVKIENKKDLNQIIVGNIVTVTYEETTEKRKDDKEGKIKVKNKLVKKIVFIKEREGEY